MVQFYSGWINGLSCREQPSIYIVKSDVHLKDRYSTLRTRNRLTILTGWLVIFKHLRRICHLVCGTMAWHLGRIPQWPL